MIRRPILRNQPVSSLRFPFGWDLDASGNQEV